MAGFPGNFCSEVKHMCARESLLRGECGRALGGIPGPDVQGGWKGREDQVGKDKFVQSLIPSPIHAVLLLSRPLG